MRKFITTLCILIFFVFAACSQTDNNGGFEAGNPPTTSQPTRPMMGRVDSTDDSPELGTSYVTSTASENCVADTVLAIDSSQNVISEEIAEDCSFTVTLNVNTAYTIQFELLGEFVGALSYTTDEEELENTVVFVTEGNSAIDLGLITFANGRAVPTTNPNSQTDQDGDGVSDADEGDDDGNGILDAEETDCDLDGIIDSLDDDVTSCNAPVDETAVQILEVIPRNQAGLDTLNEAVDLDTVVSARAPCEIDPDSVTSSSFAVEDENHAAITCDFSFSSSGKIVYCEHDSDSFISLHTYTATSEGLICSDGTPIVATTWSWLAMDLGFDLGL